MVACRTLPGLTFTVTDPHGEQVRFVHEEGQNPADESRDFCQNNFPEAPETECVEAMLANAQKALEEVQMRAKEEL